MTTPGDQDDLPAPAPGAKDDGLVLARHVAEWRRRLRAAEDAGDDVETALARRGLRVASRVLRRFLEHSSARTGP